MKKEANWFRWHMCTSDLVLLYLLGLCTVFSHRLPAFNTVIFMITSNKMAQTCQLSIFLSTGQAGIREGSWSDGHRALPIPSSLVAGAPVLGTPLSCCPCTRGLAPLHAALALARDTATSSGTNHRQKNKQELFKKFLLPPATVLSCIIFLTVYSSRI